MPLPIRIRNQLGIWFELSENSRKCFQQTRLIFIKFSSAQKNYLPFWIRIATYIKNKKKVSRVSILHSKSIDSIDTKFFLYLPSLLPSHLLKAVYPKVTVLFNINFAPLSSKTENNSGPDFFKMCDWIWLIIDSKRKLIASKFAGKKIAY